MAQDRVSGQRVRISGRRGRLASRRWLCSKGSAFQKPRSPPIPYVVAAISVAVIILGFVLFKVLL